MDTKKCFQQGFYGAVGAIPGTFAAHPFDVLKIRMQTASVHHGHQPVELKLNRSLFNGTLAGIGQKVTTRGPMFFFSEFFTQLFSVVAGGNADTVRNRMIGSALSGYATGFLSGPFEYSKVLAASNSKSGMKTNPSKVIFSHLKSHPLNVGRKMHAAGIRNAVFDSVFFGVKQLFTNSLEEGHSNATVNGLVYALAAATAVVIDYSVDRAVKVKMKTFPDRTCRSIADCMLDPFRLKLNEANANANASHYMSYRRFLRGIFLTYRGIFFKSLEFSVSYFVTGVCALQISKALEESQ